MISKRSSLRQFLLRALESLACLLLGWWLGSAGVTYLWPTPPARIRGESRASPSPGTRPSIPSPINMSAPAVAATAEQPTGLYSEWIEVPASLVTEAEAESILGVFNAVSAAEAQNKSVSLKNLLRLTPREHERLAESLRQTLESWARLTSTGLRRDPEYPNNWLMEGDAGRLKVLGQRLQEKLLAAIGPEKTGLFNALAYQDLLRLFQTSGLMATLEADGSFSLHAKIKAGAHTFYFGKETVGPAGIIANEVARLQREQPISATQGASSPP